MLLASGTFAQAAPPKAPAALETVRQAFAAAVAAQDRAAVAKLSRFPLALEVYGLPPRLSQQEFLRDRRHFDAVFFAGDTALVRCLKTQGFEPQAQTKPQSASLWLLECDGNEYLFGEDRGRWAFTAYRNINE